MPAIRSGRARCGRHQDDENGDEARDAILHARDELASAGPAAAHDLAIAEAFIAERRE